MKLFIFILLSTSLSSAFACSCSEESIQQSFKQADSVVLAVPADSGTYFSTEDGMKIHKTGMKIVKHYKGKYSKFFYLLAEKSTGANCGASFRPYDGVYLIFSYKYNSNYYITSGCDIQLLSYTANTQEEQEEYRREVDQILRQLENK